MAYNASGMTPDALTALNALREKLAAQGYSFGDPISGFRTYDDQSQLYANLQAERAHQALPYPQRGWVNAAARPGSSPHEFGAAFDTGLHGAALDAANKIAPSLGLSTVAGDPGHFQLANWGGPDKGAAPAAPAGGGGSAGGGGASGSAGPDFYAAAMQHESGGKNIPNAAGGWNAAGGYFQFTPPTWASMRAAHPELNLPANVKDATQDQQTAAYHVFAQGNVEALQKAGLPINDKNAFMASFLGGGGATKFLSAMNQNPNASAADLFPKEAAANPTVFYADGKPRSLNQVFALQTGSFGSGNTTGFGPNATAVASGASGTAAGGPAAPTGALGTAGNLPGFQADSPAAKMTAAGLKSLGLGDKDAQGGGQDDKPPDVKESPMIGGQPTPVGGPMMISPGGMGGGMAQRIAQQQLGAEGYNVTPNLGDFTANQTRIPQLGAQSPGAGPPPGSAALPGQATGAIGSYGTTLNSPSALQTAMLYGSLDPFDPYGRFSNAASNPFAGSA